LSVASIAAFEMIYICQLFRFSPFHSRDFPIGSLNWLAIFVLQLIDQFKRPFSSGGELKIAELSNRMVNMQECFVQGIKCILWTHAGILPHGKQA
jgi:hypothetical protein